ncbi:MAG: pyridoxamine 5'-phosphate oxidase family protein [Rikenellaceae bacterium]
MDQRIINFLRKHHVLTLATSVGNTPYCANAFYALDALRRRVIFTTDISTRHGSEMSQNPTVAASIVWETKLVGKIQGAQLTGKIVKADSEDQKNYIKRFPYTALAELNLWAIELDFVKFTDNTLGFGKKLIWSAE